MWMEKSFKYKASALCNRAMSLKLKKRMYKSCVRNALCYGAECWALKKDERKFQTTEMRMLRMMCGRTLRESISNQTTCDMTGVEKIEEFISEHRLQWFGHVEKMDDKRTPVKIKIFVVDGSKKDDLRKNGKKL